MLQSNKPKILAPARDFISLKVSLDAGADEIYFGIKGLNMRSGAKNFEEHDIKKIVKLCHKRNVKVLLALNTIIYEHELKKVELLIKKSKKMNVDAIICWDISIIELCRKYKIDTHVSTQASLSNYQAIKSLKENYPNIVRVVLARECTLEDIKKIVKKIKQDKLAIELEVFIHGAMCVAESGRCFMSQELFGKSANRGQCLQPCRRIYEVYLKDPEENKELILGKDYVMSPKDLCTIPIIEEIIKTGVAVLKIEGRNRNPEYVYTVVNSYRRVIDELSKHKNIDILKKSLLEELKRVYNRGFSTGFYLGKPINEWTRDYGSSSTETKQYIGKILNYYPKISVAEILIESNYLEINNEIMIQGTTTGLIKQKIETIMLDYQKIPRAEKKMIITLKLNNKVRKNDQVYKIIKKI